MLSTGFGFQAEPHRLECTGQASGAVRRPCRTSSVALPLSPGTILPDAQYSSSGSSLRGDGEGDGVGGGGPKQWAAGVGRNTLRRQKGGLFLYYVGFLCMET